MISVKLFLDLPFALNQQFRQKIVSNFKTLSDSYQFILDSVKKHEEKDHAHRAESIDYKNRDVAKELDYQNGRISRLVLGHNGDGMQELRDSRTAIDSSEHEVLSERLSYDLNALNKKADDVTQEVVDARNSHPKLTDRLDQVDDSIENSRDILLSNLDILDSIGQVPTREKSGDTKYPQGFAIDQKNNVFYLVRQTTGSVNDKTIYEYSLEDISLIRQRQLPFDVAGYIEGLAFRHNALNELEFIIPINQHGGAYVVYNFDTNKYSKKIETEMSNKTGIDNNRKYFITVKTDHPNQNTNSKSSGFNIYDLDSVFNQKPKLVRTLNFSRKAVIGDYKIQSFIMIDHTIFLSQGQHTTVTTAIDLEGNVLKRITFDKQDLSSAIGLAKAGVTDEDIFEPEGTYFYRHKGKIYLVELICSQGQACLVRHGFFESGVKVEETTVKGYGIADLPAQNSMLDNGTPTLVFNNKGDILKEIEALEDPGLYFLVCVGKVKNAPYGASTLTGWVYTRSTKATGANADRAIIEVTDISDRKFSTTLDTNRNPAWRDWQQIAGIPVVGDKEIKKLRDITRSGKYYFKADDVRRIEDMPERFVSLGAVIKHEVVSNTFSVQTAYRLNADTGYAAPAVRTIANGELVRESGHTDKYGWRYIQTAQ